MKWEHSHLIIMAVLQWKHSLTWKFGRYNDVIGFAWKHMLLCVFSHFVRYTLKACASFPEGTISSKR